MFSVAAIHLHESMPGVYDLRDQLADLNALSRHAGELAAAQKDYDDFLEGKYGELSPREKMEKIDASS
jgi:hypothetical protein